MCRAGIFQQKAFIHQNYWENLIVLDKFFCFQ